MVLRAHTCINLSCTLLPMQPMYDSFRVMAEEDASAGHTDGLHQLFIFYVRALQAVGHISAFFLVISMVLGVSGFLRVLATRA